MFFRGSISTRCDGYIGGFDLDVMWKRIFKKRSKKKAKNKQIQAREGKDQVKSKSKVIRMKKIQLEGLKLPKPQVVFQELKDKGQNFNSSSIDFTLPAPTQPSKLTSPVAINLDPIELLFSTPPSSSSFLDLLDDLPPSTTNPSPPRPSLATIERLANEPPPILPMNSTFLSPTPELEPTLPPLPPQYIGISESSTYPISSLPYVLEDEGPRSRGTKLSSTFITAEGRGRQSAVRGRGIFYKLKPYLRSITPKNNIPTLTPESNHGIRSHDKINDALFLVKGPPNKFTWYKNKVLHIRIAAYSDLTRPDLTFVSTSWRHLWDPTLGTTLVRMSAMANTTLIVTPVMKTTTKEKAPKETDAAPRVNIQDFCEEHYEDILPAIMDKIRRDKRKEVSGGRARSTGLATLTRQARLSLARIGRALEITLRLEVVLTDGTLPRAEAVPEVKIALVASKNQMIIPTPPTRQSPDMGITLVTGATGISDEGRWKSASKRQKLIDEEDLAVPWTCEEVDPFTPRIRNFKSSQKMRMPNNVKTYDKTGYLEDHVKKFQAAAQVERWAMPTWCHMFNSTLIGTARVWFDELPPESIDGYKDLKAAFLAYFMQQKKYVKVPVEIHNIKQRDGETLEDFMEHFKVETRRMKGAPECMRISRFMHGVNNPELTKRLNEHVPKTMEEMMTVTTAFI
ncbi:reverse transcriptase domain-containing protein [Tanacetum coccineum]|uniref:Reverse transcriptase domain-containing protein n=1 Tax=Tanacetum coccineum TaxID=301880 RepID=A0ABQ5GR29_9ASTR